METNLRWSGIMKSNLIWPLVMSEMSQEALKQAVARVEEAYEKMEDGSDLSGKIRAKFESMYAKPPVDALSLVLRKHIAIEEARILFFAPEQLQIRSYVTLLCEPPFHDLEHPLRSLQTMCLNLVYLLHRKNWSFLEEFVLHGGIMVLADLLATENLYMRGQVLEIILTLIDESSYDWFLPRDDILGRTLHMRMLDLTNHPTFISSLCSNRVKSFPAGGYRCLQFLAFWLSWVRVLYTEKQVLQLSQPLLDELRKWSKGEGMEEGPSAQMMEEEQKLALTILEDFGKAGPAPTRDGQSGHGLGQGQGVVGGVQRPVFEGMEPPEPPKLYSSSDDSSMPPLPPSEEDELVLDRVRKQKEKGNDLYRAGLYDAALNAYTSALDSLLDCDERIAPGDAGGADWAELEASLHFNRATSLWKIGESRQNAAKKKENAPQTSTTPAKVTDVVE